MVLFERHRKPAGRKVSSPALVMKTERSLRQSSQACRLWEEKPLPNIRIKKKKKAEFSSPLPLLSTMVFRKKCILCAGKQGET